MQSEQFRHRRRRRVARIYLIIIFVALRVADALLCVYTFHSINPWPLLRGQVAGSVLATTVLMLGISRRLMWARYGLIFFIWYTIAIFSASLLVAVDNSEHVDRKPVAAALAALAIYLTANVVVIRSRKIQTLAHIGGVAA
jgi:hypothetical protein